MKRKALLVATAIASVMTIALPALALGTGDQKGPRCTDIEKVQFKLTMGEVENSGVANPNENPGVEGDEWIVEPVATGVWAGEVLVYLVNPPCDAKGAYVVDLQIQGDSNADKTADVSHDFDKTFARTDFKEMGTASDPYWLAVHSFEIDEAEDKYRPVMACHKVESIWQENQKHVADSSPDVGTPGTDSEGRLCGFDAESGGARSYGARSYGANTGG